MLVDGNNFISHHLKNNIPFAAGKIGITELNLLYCYFHLKNGGELMEHLRHEVENNAGLFPYTKNTVKWFSEELLSLLPNIDLIPVWNRVIPQFEDFVLQNYAKNSYKTKIEELEPFFSNKPWTKYLEGKTVLVLSPFKDSIENNFLSLNKIWTNKIVNNFNLKVYKHPFAIPVANDKTYNNSYEVYQKFLNIVKTETYDVGIFGTGHTSLLYALNAKKLGKSSIHLGGSTQILFGIKGQRWKEMKRFANIFNEHWTEPLIHEKPEKCNLVEGGCYW